MTQNPAIADDLRPIRRVSTFATMALGIAAMVSLAGVTLTGHRAGAEDGPVAENVPLAFESQADDVTTDVLKVTALATLGDARGWGRAGFPFANDDASRYRILLTEAGATTALCAGADGDGTIGCQSGPIVVLNADAWRQPPEGWPDAESFRRFLINHEVGHLLGQFHPSNRCPTAGEPEVVMAPQFEGLEGCEPNAWPLNSEVFAASKRPVELAPAPGAQPTARLENPGGQTAPTLPVADEDDSSTTSKNTTAATLGTTPSDAPGGSAGEPASTSPSLAALIVLGVVGVVALSGLAVMIARKRRSAEPVFHVAPKGYDDGMPQEDPVTVDGPAIGDATAENPAIIDDEFIPLGSQDDEVAQESPSDTPPWDVRLTGDAKREGQLAWMLPHRWSEGEVAALTDALTDLSGQATSDVASTTAGPEQVGELLAGFLRARPHLAPAEHEGVGIAFLGDDQVTVVALGATEVIELRNGLAKPVRRQGVVRLHHSDESPLEVEVSVVAPARPRARIVVGRRETP